MSTVHILGIPMDLGQRRRGVDMGPSALRYAGLQHQLEMLGHEVVDHGNVAVPNPEERVAALGANRLHAVAQVCQQIYTWGEQHCVNHGAAAQCQPAVERFTLYLGGDHSISIGSVKAEANGSPATTGLIWIDAHADFNTPASSPSGNVHGMPVAVLTGDGAPALVALGGGVALPMQNVVQIGVRDVDAAEKARVKDAALQVFTMREIDEMGMARVAAEALRYLSQCTKIHVSLDLDSLDPAEAPGVGTPVPGGLTYREAHLLCEILGDSRRVFSMDAVEVNPILDQRNATARLAVELIASLLGKRIL